MEHFPGIYYGRYTLSLYQANMPGGLFLSNSYDLTLIVGALNKEVVEIISFRQT